jgi:type VI secretion system protein ImpC
LRERGKPGTKEELDAFIREAVRPHLIKTDADLPTRLAAVDEEASALMSSLLHSQAFQRVESLWRSVVALLARIDTSSKVRAYLVHLPKSLMEQDLSESGDPLQSKLHHLLSEPDLGVAGRRWAVAVGGYDFGTTPDDIQLLERIAGVAQAADVPWFSSIHPEPFVGSGQEADLGMAIEGLPVEWERFRERREAAWMGLTYPRFLVREPYGSSRRHSKVFDFKERVETGTDLLWGYGAFLCAALLAQGFAESEWRFRPENHLDLGGMPLAGLGGSATSVEVGLNVTAARHLIEVGLIPLLGVPQRAGIRLGGFHSVASTGAPFRAWWRG